MIKNKKIKLGIVQMSCGSDKKDNLQKTIKNIEKAIRQGAQIICLQELFNTIYFCYEENYDFFELAETREGESILKLKKLAGEYKVVIVVPYFEKRANGLYHNSAVVIDADGEILGNYRKNHIPDDPGYYEKFYFTPGDTGYMVFETEYAKIGILICWDQWYPEASRITSLKGAEILFYPTAIGWEASEDEKTRKDQQEAWINMQRSHAIANGVYTVAVNRAGQEKLTFFWGNSFIANPIGAIIAQAPEGEEQVLVHEIDLGLIEHYRTHWPFLRDRRVDTYAGIEQRFLD